LTPEQLGELLDEALSARDLLEAELGTFTERGIIPASRVDELERALVHRGVAFDVALFVEIFREHWSTIEGKSVLTSSQLDELEVLSHRLLAALDRPNGAPRDATLRRRQAPSLLTRARERARRAVSALR